MLKEPLTYLTNNFRNTRTCPTNQDQCKKIETSNNNYLAASTFSSQPHEYGNRNKKSKLSNLFVNTKKATNPPLSTQQLKENLPTQSSNVPLSSSTSLNNNNYSLKKKTRNSDQFKVHQYASSHHHNQPKATDENNPLKTDEMQHSSVRNLRVRKLGHVELSEEEIVYGWLEKNPSFVFEYFVSHATRFMVEQWMARHGKSSSTNGLHSSSSEHQQQRQFRRTNRSASELWANDRKNSLDPQLLSGNSHLMRSFSCCDAPITNKQVSSPMRKISARHFENSTISLEPIFRTTDEGKLSFLPIDQPLHSISLSPKKHLVNRLSNSCSSEFNRTNDSISNRHHHSDKYNCSPSFHSDLTIDKSLIMQTPNEVKLMLDCVKLVCNDLDIKSICHKILKNISILTNADRCSLFLVKENANEKYFVSILFDVSSDSDYSDARSQPCIKVPWSKGIVGHVAKVRKCENIKDCYSDERFNGEVDNITGYFTKTMLCAPITDTNGKVIGVAQAINKKSNSPNDCQYFTSSDEEIFQHFLQFCGIGLKNAQLYEQKNLENRRNQVLLDLATMIFEQQTTIEHIVFKVMLHTQSLLQVQRCQVLLLQDYNEEEQQWSNLINYYNHKYLVSDDLNNFPTQNTMMDDKEERKPNFTRKFDLEAVIEPLKCDRCSAKSGNNNHHLQKIDLCEEQPEIKIKFTTDVNHNSLPLNVGITNCVAETGQTLNILDCQQDPRFDSNIDKLINEERKRQLNTDCPECLALNKFEHKHVLCMPIRNGQRKIIGVTQLINKLNNKPFTANDESLFEAFAIFIGMGIQSTLNYENSMKANAKHRVTLQCLSYHCSASEKAAVRLSERATPILKQVSQKEINEQMANRLINRNDQMMEQEQMMITDKDYEATSKEITCNSNEIIDLNGKKRKNFFTRDEFDQLVCYLPLTYIDEDFFKSEQSLLVSIKFFEDLKLIERFNINYKTLCRWLLSVQKNYRNVCYHNWRHAFDVAEMMFSLISKTCLIDMLDEYEVLSLMIACFCHDLDHRGTNNMFEVKSSSPLHHLYSTSTMENHHRDQCIMILNSPGNQILSNLNSQEYEKVVKLVEDAILATDLAFFFKNKNRFINIKNLTDVFSTPENKSIFTAMLMTLCDLNAISKPWPMQRTIAEKVSQEFFTQGDIEKHIFNVKPIDMFNREKINELPRMQLDFINGICQPIFVHFYKIFEGKFEYRDFVLINKYNWLRMAYESESLKEWATKQMDLFKQELIEMNVDVDKIRQEADLQFDQYENNKNG